MAPRQNTFTIIPNAVGLNTINQGALAPGVSAKPPMTSKQAKKLYKQATRQPKLSKAEQRRRDLLEQDRIRKEFEEESRRARARAARERKKLKEEEKREEKRKKGLPLVTVNPSQDTISRFIKGYGAGKKRAAPANTEEPTTANDTAEPAREDDCSPNNLCSQRTDGTEIGADDPAGGGRGKNLHDDARQPAAKRRRTSEHPSPTTPPDVLQAPHGDGRKPTASGSQREEGQSTHEGNFSIGASDAVNMAADIADVPAPSGSAAKQEHSSPSASSQKAGRVTPRVALQEVSRNTERRGDKPLQASPNPNTQPPEYGVLRRPNATARRRLFMLEKTAQPEEVAPLERATSERATSREEASPLGKPHQDGSQRHNQGPRQSPAHKSTKTPAAPCVSTAKPSQGARAGSMGPPPVPPRFKAPAVGKKDRPELPKFLPRHSQSPVRPRPAEEITTKRVTSERCRQPDENLLPTSTQLFVLNHVDDLFPTPSQEARELEDISSPSLPGATKDAMPRYSPTKPGLGLIRAVKLPAELSAAQQVSLPAVPFFSSQDFVLSSQDIRELEDNTTMPSGAREGCHTEITQAARPAEKAVDRPMGGIERAACKPGSPHDTSSRPAMTRTVSTASQRSTRQPGTSGQDANRFAKNRSPSRPSSGSPGTLASRDPMGQHPSSPSVERTDERGSQPKKRFFTSSGGGAVILVAQERSLRSLAQEKRRREIQQKDRAARETEEQVRAEPLAMQPSKAVSEEDFLGDELDGITEEDLLRAIEMPAPPAQAESGDTQHRQLGESLGGTLQRSCAGQDGSHNMPIPQSQETDYGDIDLGDGEDLESLWN